MLHAVEPTSLPDQVFAQLLGQIVAGAYTPGATLPSERTLAETFAVNRHVVREALKRLEQVGLVKISQGGGTKVLDFRRTAGLDVLALIAEHAEAIDGVVPLLVPCLEMRASIGTDVARLCAAARRRRHERARSPSSADQLAAVAAGPELLPLDRAVLAADARRRRQPRLPAGVQQPDPGGRRRSRTSASAGSRMSSPTSDYRRPIAAAIAAGDTRRRRRCRAHRPRAAA